MQGIWWRKSAGEGIARLAASGLAGRRFAELRGGDERSGSVLGPRPSLIRARESGTSFVCQPLSAWTLVMAATEAASQWPLGSPVR